MSWRTSGNNTSGFYVALSANDNHYKGYINNILYDRNALTQAQITTLYNLSVSGGVDICHF